MRRRHGALTLGQSLHVMNRPAEGERSLARAPATDAIETLRRGLHLRVATDQFDNVVTFAMSEIWTRDPFDRLIVAHARLLNAVLLSRDRRVAAAYAATRW